MRKYYYDGDEFRIALDKKEALAELEKVNRIIISEEYIKTIDNKGEDRLKVFDAMLKIDLGADNSYYDRGYLHPSKPNIRYDGLVFEVPNNWMVN